MDFVLNFESSYIYIFWAFSFYFKRLYTPTSMKCPNYTLLRAYNFQASPAIYNII